MIVYGVYYNSDMTEGRGPMKLSRLYLHRDHAVTFMDKQVGVMGRKPGEGAFRNLHPGCTTWDCVKCFGTLGGDWRITEHEVLEVETLLPAKEQELARVARDGIHELLTSAVFTARMDANARNQLRTAGRLLRDLQD